MKQKYNREEIEIDWVYLSGYGEGAFLCSFVKNISMELRYIFYNITKDWREYTNYDVLLDTFTMDYFFGEYDASIEELYLLRALTLNMLLDDNEEYFN